MFSCRQMCAVKFLHLEDFFDNIHHGMPIELEPQGILFAEVCAYTLPCVCSYLLTFTLTTSCTKTTFFLRIFLPLQ